MTVYQIVPSNGKIMKWITDHSTDILTYSGIGMMAASTVTACIGTKKYIEEKDQRKPEDPLVKKVWDRSKHFALSTGLFAAGSAMIIKSDRIAENRNKILMERIASMTAATMAYRNRWKAKAGEKEEAAVFYDEKTEEIEENGKKKKVTTSTIDQAISTDIYFDRWCSWRADEHGDMDYDAQVIDSVMAVLNNKLWGDPKRMVLVNDAYDTLGSFTENQHGQRVEYRTVAGQVSGWILDKQHPTGDNTITITRTKTYRRLDDGQIVPTWRLSFNHDGNIMKAAQERGLLG